MQEKKENKVDGFFDGNLNRREFLGKAGVAALATTGIAGILASKTPPAFAQEREIRMMTWSHFVPASDEELKRQLQEFGKMEGIKVSLDRVAHLQVPAVHATEVQGKSGHDISFMWIGEPYLYTNYLAPVGDLVEKIATRGGGLTDDKVGRGTDGRYHALPWYFISFPIALRTDLIADLGENLPDTWEDVLRIGAKLKKKGHPVGIQIAHSFDSNAILRGIIWSWGGSLVAKDSKTVVLNSKETLEAYKFIKRLYKEAMEPEVLAWDDRNNNVCLNSGKCSMILNPVSAYNSAVRDNTLIPGTDRPVHQVINHIIPPKGPAGRYMSASYNVMGIWKWTKNLEACKKFIEYHFQPEQQNKFITASLGYNQPLLKAYGLHPIYASNPKFYFAPYIGEYTHAPGWPGSPTAATQVVWDKYIIPDTVGEYVTGKLSAEDAVKKAESMIKREYRRYL